jgi:hypothetical protein
VSLAAVQRKCSTRADLAALDGTFDLRVPVLDAHAVLVQKEAQPVFLHCYVMQHASTRAPPRSALRLST